MKLKFKTRFILTNIAISAAMIALIGAIVIEGILSYSINNYVSNLSSTANEASILINQSILSTQTSDQEETLYQSGGTFYAQEIAKIYSIQVMLFDTDINLIGTTFEDADTQSYVSYASTVMDSNKQSYLYTEINSTNYVILFSPIVINDKTVGICALFASTSSTDQLVYRTLFLFIYATLGVSAVLAAVYTYTYARMLKPINQLVDYTKDIAEGKTLNLPEIDYKSEDEIKELIESNVSMVEQINEKIEETNYEKEKLSAVIASMQDAVLAVNLSNEVMISNAKLDEYFSVDSGHLSFIPHIQETIVNVIATRENVSYEFEFNDKYFLMNGNLIASENKEDGVLIVIKDITAEKKIEEEQNKFISSVSHELRTPLTTIIGYIDMLLRRGTKDEQLTDKALNTAKKESQRLLRLVNDLLNINRYHNVDFDFVFKDIDPNALIEEAVSEMNIKRNSHKNEVIYTSIDLPHIQGDYDRLKQVLLNVIDNAIKYSNEEDIVKVTATYDEKNLEITVRDFGEGIPEDMREKVFETFYRVEEDRSRLRGGFGLGLSIVKNIIEKHNGTVRIESIPQEGTLVVITLPLPSNDETGVGTYEEI